MTANISGYTVYTLQVRQSGDGTLILSVSGLILLICLNYHDLASREALLHAFTYAVVLIMLGCSGAQNKKS